MPWYRMHHAEHGDSVAHINFGRKKGVPVPCQAPYEWAHGTICGQFSAFQCDWKMGGESTCDRHLCKDHATEVGANKHLCPEHTEAYEKWKAKRASQQPSPSP